jgi:NYN domain/OST-HTH/LOTUS domain
MSDAPENKRLAVLIDADNASAKIVDGLFEEIARIGEASVRRIYGDLSQRNLKPWVDVLHAYGILPQQNFASVKGKNASDIAMVIDAMDLLHAGRLDGICLVSSDSDFTRLAARIREQGLDVYGFGEQKTPESFRMACKRFIYTENLLPGQDTETDAKTPPPEKKQPPSKATPLINRALNQIEDAEGWYHLGGVGKILNNLKADFDPRSYGCRNLSELAERTGAFEVSRPESGGILIRPKKGRSKKS